MTRALRPRRIAIAGSALAVGVALAWRSCAREGEVPLPIAADAGIERALAREAERAQREGPSGEPAALAPEGFRALAERSEPPELPAPAAKHRPRALAPGPPARARVAHAPGALAPRREIARPRPPPIESRARFLPSVRSLATVP